MGHVLHIDIAVEGRAQGSGDDAHRGAEPGDVEVVGVIGSPLAVQRLCDS